MIEKSIFIPKSILDATINMRLEPIDFLGNPLNGCYYEKFGYYIHEINEFERKGEYNKYDGDLNCTFNLFVVRHFKISGTRINDGQNVDFSNEYYSIYEYLVSTTERLVTRYQSNKLYNVEFYLPDDDYLKEVLQKDVFKPHPIMPLAHYTKMETAIENILPNEKNRLLLKELCKTNDPVESKKLFHEFITFNENNSPSVEYVKQNILKFSLKNDYEKMIKSISFSKDTKTERKAYSLPTMWAHYGQNHEGICLVFHKKTLKNIFSANFGEKVRKSSIKYDKLKLPDFKKEGNESSEEFFLKNADELFFKKDSDWGSESEYRFVVVNPEKDMEDGKCYLGGIDQALVAIILGVDFKENYLPAVEELWRKLTNKNIGLYKLVYRNGKLESVVINGPDIFEYYIVEG